MMYLVIVTFRVQAAYDLNQRGIDVDFVRKWRTHIGDTSKKSSTPKPISPGLVVKRLREKIAKVGPRLRKAKGGGVDVHMV
jgi:hypothetical protein